MAKPLSQTRALGAQISHMLKDRGVDVIFGIPGVHNQEMYRGIEEAGITHVLARHEQGAGFMADGYARASGQPGVAYVITGPGLCNIMTPMGQAYSDSVPMLVISSCLDETAATRGQLHQMLDQRAAAATVCDWSEEAGTAQAAYHFVDKAMFEFTSKRARPKHIQVPITVLEGQAEAARPALPYAAEFTQYYSDVDDARDAMLQAKRPVVIFGGGVHAAHAAHKTYQFAHRLGAAVFVTYAGRGVIAPSYPLFLGSTLARDSSRRIFEQADLVVAIGTELAEVDIWRGHLGHNCPLVRVDIDVENLTPAKGTDIVLQGNALMLMAQISAELPKDGQSDWQPKEIAKFVEQARAEVEAEYPRIPTIADALKSSLPPDTMIYSDMTQFAYAAKETWDMDKPGHWHHPYGFGTLGYALPAAIGGQIGRPGQPTMAIVGDYGFHYTMQELGVAVELGLSLPIILWDNGKLGAIEASMVSAQIAPNAVVARNPDFVKLAEAFGAGAVAPQSLAQMQDAVRAAFDADGPTLIYLTPDVLR